MHRHRRGEPDGQPHGAAKQAPGGTMNGYLENLRRVWLKDFAVREYQNEQFFATATDKRFKYSPREIALAPSGSVAAVTI